jgi:hypothetical protein
VKQLEKYYQTIANRFFQLRGAPFFLSSKEVGLIENWQTQKIPLSVILDGMKVAYENYRRWPYKGRKKFTLLICHRQVLKEFEQHKERKVGTEGRIVRETEKLERIKREIEKFLENIPEPVRYLQARLVHIHDRFDRGDIGENQLEQFEDEIEALLLRNAASTERDRAAKEVDSEFSVHNQQELDRFIQIKLLKNLRDKYKIPHISPFYY